MYEMEHNPLTRKLLISLDKPVSYRLKHANNYKLILIHWFIVYADEQLISYIVVSCMIPLIPVYLSGKMKDRNPLKSFEILIFTWRETFRNRMTYHLVPASK